MESHLRKSIISMSFDDAVDQLKKDLYKEGFDIGGITQFHYGREFQGNTEEKYQILHVYNLFLYNEMMRISPVDGIVLPCSITVKETQPGEVALIAYNATEHISRDIQSPSLQNLAAEVTRRLDYVLHALDRQQTSDPDLVTSWG